MSLLRFLSKFTAGLWLAAGLLAAGAAQAQSTLLRIQTTQGEIEMQLLDAQAPLTVANFLTYVRGGDYADLMFSRSVKGFVLQAGGVRWPEAGVMTAIPRRATVINEFNLARSNVRGTVALAKVDNLPNSGSSEWFFNVANNASNLDTQNGGFTVFGRVTTAGMEVVDKIAKLQVVDASALQASLSNLPVVNWPAGANLKREHTARVTGFSEIAPKTGVTDSDRIFDYLEATYSVYLPPEGKQSGTGDGYIYRYFPSNRAYIATKDNQVWYQVPPLGADISLLGPVADWLFKAAAAGY